MRQTSVKFGIIAVQVVVLLLHMPQARAQSEPVKSWLTWLKDDSPNQVWSRYRIYYQASKMDTAQQIEAALALYDAASKGNKRLRLLGKSARAKLLFYMLVKDQKQYATQMKECLNEAIKEDDPWLQAEFGRWYSEMLNSLNQKELAVQYASSALKLMEYLGYEHFPIVSVFYMWVGETLLVQEYFHESVSHLYKGMQLAQGDTLVKPFRFMFTYNNLGLAYRQLKQYDSAIYYFNLLQAYSSKTNRPDWVEIGYSNRLPCFVAQGQLDSARAIARHMLSKSNLSKGYPEDEIVATENLGKIAIQEKDYARAVQYLQYTQELNQGKNPRIEYRVQAALAQCYEMLGQPGKAYPYLKRVNAYNDSLRRAKENFNKRYVFIKAEYDQEQLRLKQLAAEARQAIYLRNMGIAALLVLSAVAIVWLNRRRAAADRLQQQAAAELVRFKEEVIIKNDHIDELLASLQKHQTTGQEALLADELSRQMILTESDWENFKNLFEKSYPGFLKRLRDKATGITEAEQRMAALLKLQLNTRQIAAMQGISPDSVHKTRQRLRQRFGTGTTAELEAILAAM